MADHVVGLFFGEKMRQKKVTCEFCAEELEVRAKSEGPFYCNMICEQIRKTTVKVGETLSIDRNYIDLDDDPMWRELSITTAPSEEEVLRDEREASIEAARKKNQEAQKEAARLVDLKMCTVYKFSGEIYKHYETSEYVRKKDDCFVKKRLLRKELQSLIGS
jgi:hypothetical protein